HQNNETKAADFYIQQMREGSINLRTKTNLAGLVAGLELSLQVLSPEQRPIHKQVPCYSLRQQSILSPHELSRKHRANLGGTNVDKFVRAGRYLARESSQCPCPLALGEARKYLSS